MFRWLTRCYAACRARLERRRGLAAMDGRTLEDIGLSRGALVAALLGGDLAPARQNHD